MENSEVWNHEPEILSRLHKEGIIKLLRNREISQGSKMPTHSDYYGEYTFRTLGVIFPHLFKTADRYKKCVEKLEKMFNYRKEELVIYKESGKPFPCFIYQVVVREDNTEWSIKDTGYEQACIGKKPCKYLPISIPEKTVQRFLDRFPELLVGVDKFNDALWVLEKDYF